MLQLVPQVAVADAACIVALPFALARAEPAGRVRAWCRAPGRPLAFAVAVRCSSATACGEAHPRISEQRKFAVELRTSLPSCSGSRARRDLSKSRCCWPASCFGLGVSLVGEPRRLARQLFAVTEGFFGPVFFVWLGTSLDLRALGAHPALSCSGPAGSGGGGQPRRGTG